jgi:hypothetical protein
MWRLLLNLPLVASYCDAGNTIDGDSNLGRVSLEGQEGKSIHDETNCPGGTGLQDRTFLKASIIPGGNFTLHFQATTCDAGWARLAYAFIDFNNNNMYEPGELLGSQYVDNRVIPEDISFPFTVPCIGAGAVAGVTHMRVMVVESGFNPEPCLTFSYGGVKEFSIEIIDGDCKSPGRYCSAGNTVAGGSNLGAVDMLGLLRTSINDQSNCPGGIGVRDFTQLAASVMPGGTYTLNLDVTTCNAQGFERRAYAYIDFNRNSVYDPEELVGFQDVSGSPAPVEVAFKYQVPCNAVSGLTRMRVLVVEGGHDTDPCMVFAYGGVKEYSVVILSQLDRSCLPPVRYCKTGSSLAGGSNLGPVELVGVQGTSISDSSNCPNSPGIRNLTNLSVQVQPGGSYVLTLKATTCDLGWARLAYAYIDYNGNSVFEPLELIGSSPVDNRVAPVTISFTFAVPCIGDGSIVGPARLRVFVVEGDDISADPCALFNYGAVKEFTVDILNKPIKLCSGGDAMTI